jgi:acyl-CoA synthetase (AMP-forming)/AMP-acid ligase II
MAAPPTSFVGTLAADKSWTLDFHAALSAMRETVAAGLPVVMLGTAFGFVHMVDWLVEQNLRLELPPGSRVMETGGYKGRSRVLSKPALHSLISRQVGVPRARIVSEYGMSELSSQAYDRDADRDMGRCGLFQFPHWAQTRIVSPESGEEVSEGEAGLICIYDLANAFSVMAVQTEDLAVRRGNGFELLGRRAWAEPRGCSLVAAG